MTLAKLILASTLLCATSVCADAPYKPKTSDLLPVLEASPFVLRVEVVEVGKVGAACYRHRVVVASVVKGGVPATEFVAEAPLKVGYEYLLFRSPLQVTPTNCAREVRDSTLFINTVLEREALEIRSTSLLDEGMDWLVLRFDVYEVPPRIPQRRVSEEVRAMKGPPALMGAYGLALLPAVLGEVQGKK